MKSRTLISFCHIPLLNPSHGIIFSRSTSLGIVVAIGGFLSFVTLKTSSQSEQRACVACDHQLLIGRDHPCRDFALPRGDTRTFSLVRLCIQLHSQPARSLADSLSYLG